MHRDTEHVHATFCGGKKVASVLYVRRLNEASAIASGIEDRPVNKHCRRAGTAQTVVTRQQSGRLRNRGLIPGSGVLSFPKLPERCWDNEAYFMCNEGYLTGGKTART